MPALTIQWRPPRPEIPVTGYTKYNCRIKNIIYLVLGIRHMRVPLWPIRRAGSWGYLAGSWREATPNVINILINIRENETIIL